MAFRGFGVFGAAATGPHSAAGPRFGGRFGGGVPLFTRRQGPDCRKRGGKEETPRNHGKCSPGSERSTEWNAGIKTTFPRMNLERGVIVEVGVWKSGIQLK